MHHLQITIGIYSYRYEIGIIITVLIAIILLPLITILTFLSNGNETISDALTSVNTITRKVEIRDVKGKIIVTLDTKTTWPIRGIVTQEFGRPNLPYQTSHTGIDIDGGLGSPVTVFMPGKVLEAGNNVLDGCGSHCIIIDHDFGITSIYAHMSKHYVIVGQTVNPGNIIGLEGEEGWAHGAHLHFEIKVANLPVNPRNFITGNPSDEL